MTGAQAGGGAMWENIGFLFTVFAVGYVFIGLVLPKFGLRG